ncbi:AAA family ATPase [Desulfobacter sp.]|uniref:AAA family ATPase n=1 Tax=Desulfobacter sp. TaxID=2294 RepID=UPI000E95B2C4|nr:AAA family ATPase [Desulfobacter sp.]HBT88139.1 hypothetical protein [Desulfobacter sp.]
MLITAITIENFKGIQKPVRVELKPITLFFGPNSAGKSTIIQAMHYAHEIFERKNLNPDQTLLGGNAIDLGGFESMVNGHDKTKSIKISFDLDLQKSSLPDYSDIDEEGFFGTGYLEFSSDDLADAVRRMTSAVVQVTVTWSDLLKKAYVSEYSVSANGEKLVSIVSSEDTKQIYISELNNRNPIFFEESYEKYEEDVQAMVKKHLKNLSPEAFAQLLEKSKDTKSDVDIDWKSNKNRSLNDRILIGSNEKVPVNQSSALPNWGTKLSIGWELKLHDEVFGKEDDIRINRDLRYSSLITGPGELVRNELAKLCYIGPIRSIPPRGYRPFSSPSSLNRWADGLAAYDVLLNSDEPFLDNVNSWMANKDRLFSGYRVEVKKYREISDEHPLMKTILQDQILDEDVNLRDLLSIPLQRRLLIRDEARDIELSPHDIGVGISQVLPVVVAALHRKSGVVVIEQPELHIHPAFQVALGDLFIEQIRQRPGLTFILETHSEHLMLRFLRRIRETAETGENKAPENLTLVPEDLSINFLETGNNGISCTQIRVDEDGDFIDRWPQGFFAERAGELF